MTPTLIFNNAPHLAPAAMIAPAPAVAGSPRDIMEHLTHMDRALTSAEIGTTLQQLAQARQALAARASVAPVAAELADLDGAMAVYLQMQRNTQQQEWQRAAYAVQADQACRQNYAMAAADSAQRFAAANCNSQPYGTPCYPTMPPFGMSPYMPPMPMTPYPIPRWN